MLSFVNMNSLLVLQNRAVKAAQEERWEDATEFNQDILIQDPRNLSALNRLGFACMKLDLLDEAKETYTRVLELDKANAVAKKYLAALEKNQPVRLPKALSHSEFIDEPGKTKSVQLVRPAGQEVLDDLSIGDDCELKATQTRVSISCRECYVGTLPDDLSQRLRPLLEAGNTYTAKVQSLKNSSIILFIRETSRAVAVTDTPSFPPDHHMANLSGLDRLELGREDEEPVDVSEIDSDEGEHSLDHHDLDEALEKDFDDDFDEAPSDSHDD